VLDALGPAEGAQVELVDLRGFVFPAGFAVAQASRFDLGAFPPGSYTVRATRGGKTAEAMVEVASEEEREVVLRLERD